MDYSTTDKARVAALEADLKAAQTEIEWLQQDAERKGVCETCENTAVKQLDEVCEKLSKLKQLYGTACVRLQELSETEVPLHDAPLELAPLELAPEETSALYHFQAGPDVQIEVRVRSTTELELAAARYRKSSRRAPFVCLENALLGRLCKLPPEPQESIEGFEAALALLRTASEE